MTPEPGPPNHASPDAQTAEAEVHDLSTDGRGVARVGGTVYFVDRAMPGDRALLGLDPHSKPPSAVLLRVLEPSPYRTPHPCPHASECRGSPWGHLDYGRQLVHKTDLVRRTLRRVLGDLDIPPAIASPRPWHYRNRLSLRIWIRDQRVSAGFQSAARQTVGIDLHTCKLGLPAVDEALGRLAAYLAAHAPEALEPLPERVQLHTTSRGAGALFIFRGVVREPQVQAWEARIEELGLAGGGWYAQGTRAGIVGYDRPVRRGRAAELLLTEALGHRLEVHPAAFTQANPSAAGLVEERLTRLRSEWSYEAVWDLYGGYGALGMAAADPDQPVHVVELSPFAESTMRDLAARTRHTRTLMHHGDLLHHLPDLVPRMTERDLAILDPPRSGAHPGVLQQLVESRVRRLVYLSCNPARLQRDISLLAGGGFRPVEVRPYDFFPQTAAMEALALLERKTS